MLDFSSPIVGSCRRTSVPQRPQWHLPPLPRKQPMLRISDSHPTRCVSSTPRPRPKTALFFPGQGVQRIGMLKPWLAAFPSTCHPFFQHTDSLLALPTPLSDLIAHGPSSALSATENAQPAIMVASCLILRVLEQDFGFVPKDKVDVTLGHSLGEFAALVAGGYLNYKDALQICRRRAEVMAACSRGASLAAGGAEFGMVALVCEPEHLDSLMATIEEFLGHAAFPPRGGEHEELAGEVVGGGGRVPSHEQVLIANINSKNQIVLSGEIGRIQALLVQLRQFGGHDPRAMRLNADAPFHSPIMEGARAETVRLMGKAEVRFPGSFPCVSNVSARPFGSEGEVREGLARQCVETVRWWESIRWLDREFGVKRWVGLGPGKVGRNLVGKEVGRAGGRGGGVWGVSEPKDVEEMLRGLEEMEEGEE